MDLGVSGRAYAVIGGSRGMGFETARILAQDGARVAIISRAPEVAADTLARETGAQVAGFAADIAAAGALESVLAAAKGAIGPLRGLALTNHFMGQTRGFADMPDAEWHEYFQNSLMAAVRTCRAVLPDMAEQGGGSVVLTSAFSSRSPKPFIPAYAAFKAALNNLTKTLAKDYGPRGVRVNAVAPGAIRTGRYEERLAVMRAANPAVPLAEAESRMLETMGMKVALNRIGEAREVADVIAFLLSERAAYATGIIANVDGGTDF